MMAYFLLTFTIPGLCDKKQKEITNAINRARRIGR